MHSVLRQRLCTARDATKLPCTQEYADALLTVYLSSMTKSIQQTEELGGKLSLAYDKSFKRGGRGF